ncbi:hypothetical protein J5N97_011529 [Dioscorea zingiberensis]|uniref:DYW domain-containing protein n=1 Tax=Dioscorea zingiberensis TaxID=325984 RepID=A0A9D5D2C5_9LILI|nr:hypothetical protein J5N97_011529 [Dioscorea zingiberensis]
MLVFGQALKPSMLSFCLPLPPRASNVESNSLRVCSNKRFGIVSSELSLALQHCIETRSFNEGRKIHSQIREAGFEKNRDLLPKLIKFYSVCGRADVARELFDRIPKRNLDVFIWTSMISAYIKNGFPGEAIKLFSEMLTLGLMPDSYTVSALVKASTGLGYNGLVNQLHSMSVKCGCCSSLSVPNSLIHAYGTFGNIDAAFRVFDRIELRDIVSWSSMVRACSCLEKYAESMSLFSRMQSEEHLTANEITLVSVLPACSFFSSLRKGQAIHAYVIRKGFDQNPIVNAALVTMYSRCGDPGGAFVVFNSMVEWNVVLWTSMIEGFAMNGEFDLALNLFERIQKLGLKPNYVTLVVILAACSHGGLIDEGLKIFWTMKERFGITPQIEHYACVVDMLGRGGRLDDAEKFIEKMAIPPSASVYGSLLGACQAHRNVKLGERAAFILFELEPNNAANYVILSNIYASVERWDDVGKVRQLMASKRLSKNSGCSWIEIKDKVYVFGAHDRSHSESESIYKVLQELGERLAEAGYVPSTKYVLLDVEEDDKKRLLCSHSERLAIGFGLLKSPPSVPIRIAKNLRVCGDCHDAIKLISKVISRQLIIRDTNRFHHFSQGACSCRDYWWIHNLQSVKCLFASICQESNWTAQVIPNQRSVDIQHMKVEDVNKLIEIIKQAAKEGALLLYTLADPSMAEAAKHGCQLWGVPATDILSPTTEAIAAHLGVAPSGIPRGAPGRNPLSKEYFKRIEAIDFTIKQDDGALPQNLNRADIVLVGVSRTGKTPLSIYLAQKAYKVANVPIVMGVDPPKTLFEINQEKVFGLTINPVVLQTIRKARAKSLGFSSQMKSNYSDMEHVREEIEFANRIFSQNPVWPVIEVTGKAIEETAAVVVSICHDRKKKCSMPSISKRY